MSRALAVFVAMTASAAWPCQSPIDCPRPDALSQGVPANTPGFAIEHRLPAPVSPLTLADGGAVATEDVGMSVRPLGSLIEGTSYVLHDSCPPFGPLDQTFTAGPPAKLPTKVGRLTRIAQGVGSVEMGRGECTTTQHSAFAQFEIVTSPELAPFLPATALRLEIDGKTAWAATRPGGDLIQRGIGQSRRLDLVFARCGMGLDQGLEPGFHIARLKAELPGVVLEPAEAEFELDCAPPSARGGGCGAGAGGPLLIAAVIVARARSRATRRPAHRS